MTTEKRNKIVQLKLAESSDVGEQGETSLLLSLAEQAEFFHTPDREGWATVPVNDHGENWPIRSEPFQNWLLESFYRLTRRAPKPKSLAEVIRLIGARAQFDGKEHAVHIRVAQTDDRIEIDLGDDQWRVLEVSSEGFSVKGLPAKFRRKPGMLSLPEPESGGSIEDVRSFVNLTEGDWYLLAAWLTAALRPRGPFPLLILNGEQGSGKSTAARVLRNLVDPSSVPLRRPPRNERDLMISANNSWLVCLDNLSAIKPVLSDSLCCIATGGGFSTRKLYTDDGEALFEVQRPVLVNGIDDLAERGDLLDRSLILQLPKVGAERRMEESAFWGEFRATYPKLFGAVLEAVSGALRELPDVHLQKRPRMADFARWGVALERALGWPAGAFQRAYERNLQDSNSHAIDSTAVGPVILDFIPKQPGARWEGTSGQLLELLTRHAEDRATKDRRWPRTPQAMGNLLRRLAPNLRRTGFEVDFWREGKQSRRMVSIAKLDSSSSEMSATSA